MFHCLWGESSEQLLEHYKWQTPKGDGVWNNIVSTNNKDEADYHIVLDGGFPKGVPMDRCIYFQREEPDIMTPRLDFPDDLLFQGTYTDMKHHMVSVWRVKRTHNYFSSLKYEQKKKKISTITSGKTSTFGHKFRIAFLMDMVEKYKDIDIYGRYGIEHFGLINECFKGEVNNDGYCKFDGIYPYQYHLSFENSQHLNCINEKPLDCLLCWTMPIYWGCPNIDEWLPEGSYYNIKASNSKESAWSLIDEEVDKLIEFINKPPTKENIKAIDEARYLVLNKYNLWAEIEAIIDGKPVGKLIKERNLT
tara:strand:- start:1539 stop:2456 length:918 start_codon:yes stop_codon:yes gene_type:complete